MIGFQGTNVPAVKVVAATSSDISTAGDTDADPAHNALQPGRRARPELRGDGRWCHQREGRRSSAMMVSHAGLVVGRDEREAEREQRRVGVSRRRAASPPS